MCLFTFPQPRGSPSSNSKAGFARSTGYETGFVDHYLIPVIYPAGLTRNSQFMLGAVAVALNLGVYIFLLHRWRRRTG